MLKYTVALVALAVAAPALAQIKGAGEVGAVSARGNTDTDNLNAKLDLSYVRDEWKNAFNAAALYGSNDDITSANRWETRWQSDYNYTPRNFWFGGLRDGRDHFGAFSYQQSAAAGIGYKFIDTEPTKLSAQIGGGVKKSREQTLVEDDSGAVIDRIDGATNTSALITAGANFEHELTATTKIVDKLNIETDRENTFIQNDIALQVAINAKFSLALGYGIRKSTSPAPDSDSMDTITTLNLVYKIE